MGKQAMDYNDLEKKLTDFGYTPLPASKLRNALESDFDSALIDLIVYLCNELTKLYELDEVVNFPVDGENIEFFLLELSSILNELECPFDELVRGPVTERFVSVESKQRLISFLVGHLECARLTALSNLEKASQKNECNEMESLKTALKAMSCTKVPPNLTIDMLFTKLRELLNPRIERMNEIEIRPLFKMNLNPSQWNKVSEINTRLAHEYRNRIQLLLKRLDVTIESFTWADHIKRMQDRIHAVYRPKRDKMMTTSDITIINLLAASSDHLNVDKASSEKQRQRTSTKLNKILIASPGDRGGRPTELRAPPPEMPPWKTHKEAFSSDGGRGRGRGGQGRGGMQTGGRVNDGSRGGGGWQNQVMLEYANQRHQQQYEQQGYQQQGYQQQQQYQYAQQVHQQQYDQYGQPVYYSNRGSSGSGGRGRGFGNQRGGQRGGRGYY